MYEYEIKKYGSFTWQDQYSYWDKQQSDFEQVSDLLYFMSVATKVIIPKSFSGGDHYVYACYSEKGLVYIGSGAGDRFKHANSGISHNKKLNEIYFLQAGVDTCIVREGLTKEDSLTLEKQLIAFYNPEANEKGKTKMLYRKLGSSPYENYLNFG